METFDRSSYPDSLHSGHGHPRDWIAKPYSIVSTGVVVAGQIEPLLVRHQSTAVLNRMWQGRGHDTNCHGHPRSWLLLVSRLAEEE